MSDPAFDSKAYLTRIGLSGPLTADAQGLARLVRAQGFSIPFENFDILLERGIDLEPAAVFRKLVRSPRGGYCFELNGLLLRALHAFGFQARPLLARVHLRGTPTGRTHQLILVTINGAPWLADVGFGGGGLLAPIPFELDRVFEQDGLQFRLVRSELYDYMLQLRKQDYWQDLYSFDLTHVGAADILLGNHFTATCAESFFTFARVATLPIPGGRLSLMNFSLKITQGGREQLRELPPGPAYLEALAEHFGIQLDAPYEQLRPVRT